MAKLPQYRQQATRQASQAPQLTVDTSLTRAVNQFSQGVTQLARVRGQMQDREARDYVIESQNITSVSLTQEKSSLAESAKNGSEYTDGITSFIEQQKAIALERAPNPKAAEATGKYYDNLLANESSKSIPVAARMNAANTAKVQREALQINFNSTLQNPNEYQSSLDNGATVIATSDLPENQKEEAIKQFDSELTYYRFKGQIKNDPALALDELNSGEWNAKLNPKQLGALTNEAEQQVKSVNAADKKKLSADISDYIAYKSAGGEDTRSFDEASLKAVYGAYEGAAIYSRVQEADKFAEDYGRVALADASDLPAIAESQAVTGPEGFRVQTAQSNTIIKAINKRNSDLAKDPAMYALKSPNVQAEFELYQQTGDGKRFAEVTTAEQERLGVPRGYESVIPKKQAAAMVEQYQQGGEDAGVFMSNLKQQFGDYTSQVLRDLTAAGLSPNAATVAILPQGSRGATYLAQADKEGIAVLNKTIDPDDSKDIKSNSDSVLTDYRQTIYNPTTYAQIKGSVELLATKYISARLYDDASDALEAAASDIINSRYEFVGDYRVPNTVDSSKVERGIDSILPQIKDMDLQIPFSNLPPDVSKEVYKERLKPKALTMNDDTGVIIVDQFNQPILQANGEVITYPWNRIAEDELPWAQLQNLPTLRGI